MPAIEEIPYPKDIMRESERDLVNLLVVGPCCNGLICVRDYFDCWSDTEYHYSDCNMILWNPLTSDYKIIPESDAWIRPESSDFISLDIAEFGIDRKTRDDKIFKYFTDRSGKCHITGANGEFHWWDTDLHNNYRNQIVSFDLSDEIFKAAPIPDASSKVYYQYHMIFTISDYVALLLSPNCDCFIERLDMWVMFEYGVVQSWSKLFTVSFSSHVERPLGLLRNGEIFIATVRTAEERGELLLWNPCTEAISDILVNGVEDSVQIVTFNGEVNQV
ncbi:F-box/kelch-repeat protein At3g06240-like [Mercurialis annua]|uniref:F-box/kelch-repeat protein At3g06240-like n=1 Tax=Mercurialis annua TaxID=3986 RepID=UPI0024AD4A8F|nr:F-box/kelch-repeat protein At3g06240-like [Mercurialis annua]